MPRERRWCEGTLIPVVILRDGPTVGGYPKLGVIDPEDVDWLVQTAPGQSVRFTLACHD